MADPVLHGRNQNRTVTILTRLWARQSRGLNPSRGKRFFCLQKCPDRLRGPPNLLCNDWFLYWGKAAGA